MNMKWTCILRRSAAAVCAGVLFVAPAALADDEAPSAAPDAADGQKSDKFFFPLVRCDELRGATLEVLKPRTEGWIKAEEKKFYPLGSAFRVVPAVIGPTKVSIAFGLGSRILVTNAAEFATREISIGSQSRTVELARGLIEVSLPRTLKDGLFSVAAPYFTCLNMAGDSRFDYSPLDDGDEAVVRVITGSLSVKGMHYEIPRMGPANQIRIHNEITPDDAGSQIRIRTSKDAIFTSIRGESGDCLAKLDQGLVQQKDYETGEVKEIAKSLDFQISPLCAIKIFRRVSDIGGRIAVSMMTFSANGKMTHRCVFAENRSNVNSGELVMSPAVAKDADRKAGEADAEATEAVDVAVPAAPAQPAEPAPAADAQQDGSEETPAPAPKQKAEKNDDDF